MPSVIGQDTRMPYALTQYALAERILERVIGTSDLPIYEFKTQTASKGTLPMAWSSKPPKESGPRPRTLWRAEAKKSRGGVILSEETLGVGTHYHQGRTVLCEDEGCELCLLYGPARWYGFWAVWHGTDKPATLFQFTSGVWHTVESYLQKWTNIRGAKFVAERANARHNSRVVLTIDRAEGNPDDLPKAFDVEGTLRKIWRLPVKRIDDGRTGSEQESIEKQMKNRGANGRAHPADSPLAGMEPNR